MTESLFISDLHLDPTRPRATAAFLRFLQTDALAARRLYILGDLFEFWIGDDDDDAHARTVLDALRAYTTAGHECRVQRGNRDFLLGKHFERRTGARVLADPALEEVCGQRVLVMHGDLLCTADRGYQRYRRVVNDPFLQRLFVRLPRDWRRGIGREGRRRSAQQVAVRRPEIMDVEPAAVAAAFMAHDVRYLVHGHTHRPAIHELEIGGVARTRIVLGDWYEQGSVLAWSASGFELRALPFG